MTNQQEAQPRRRVRPRPRMVTVKQIERLTPGCARVVFTGPELEGFATKGPAEHLKVLLPREAGEQVVLPEWGPEGPVLQDGQAMPPSRTYTPRSWDPEKLELTVDFMLHGEGLASEWAGRAKAGDVVAVSGQPGGAWEIDPWADWFLLAADESALPGLATILEALPEGKPARVLVEVKDEAEQQELASTAHVDLTWLYRGDTEQPSALLEQAIRDVVPPDGNGRIWVACEAGVMRNIRRHLLDERGFDRGQIHTHGYWKTGASNHPDHDVGQEI